jgi:hypothetical protein
MKKYLLYFRLFLACALLATCLLASGLSAESLPAHSSPVSIDISSLLTFLDTLPPDEKDEQLRDWAAYGPGSFADADIFCASLVSAADAEKLADGKTVIK